MTPASDDTDAPCTRACEAIMGERLAQAIILDMGLHWCVVAALADERNKHHPGSLAIIRRWLADRTAEGRT